METRGQVGENSGVQKVKEEGDVCNCSKLGIAKKTGVATHVEVMDPKP